MSNPALKKIVFELPLEQQQQLVKAFTVLGYKTQKAWLQAHIDEDYKKALEEETKCQKEPQPK